MIIMGATEDFRSSTNPIKRNNFFINLSYHQPRGLLIKINHIDEVVRHYKPSISEGMLPK